MDSVGSNHDWQRNLGNALTVITCPLRSTRLNLSAESAGIQEYFSLTINQRTVLSVTINQRNEQAVGQLTTT
jgi:hypothetical protein